MGKNRDRLSIVADILETTNSASNKTRIMFSANLSFKLLEKYLDVVVGAGFVRVDGSTYFLTELGREFLKQYRSFRRRYKKTQGMLEAMCSEHKQLDLMCERRELTDSLI